MKRSNLRGRLGRGLGFLLLYAFTSLIPLGIYIHMQGGGEAEKAGGAESNTAQSEVDAAAPGFLEGVSVNPAPEEKAEAADNFTLFDQATGQTRTLTAQELLPAAIACEMDLSAPPEALKAQAVACYTLFSKQRQQGQEIVCDSGQWLVWTDEASMRARWGEDFDGLYGLLTDCVEAVAGQLLTVDGEPITATYFAISGGSTEDAANVWVTSIPGIWPVASPGDMLADGYLSEVILTPAQLAQAAEAAFPEAELDLSGPEDSWLMDIAYTPSGYVETAKLCGMEVSGSQLRSALSLRSACVESEFRDGAYHLTVRGWGHGVGMSQAGAAFLAKRGASYREILAQYYPGAVLTQE